MSAVGCLVSAGLFLGCQVDEVPLADLPVLREGSAGTARAYDVEYDVENDVVTSIRERSVDAEWHDAAAQERLDFLGEEASAEFPWTQMRVNYVYDDTTYTLVASLTSTEVGEDFLDDAAKAYGAEFELRPNVRFVLQTDHAMTAGESIDVELHAPEVFGTRSHRLVFSGEDYVTDESETGQSTAYLTASGFTGDWETDCEILEVYPGHNLPNDENRIDLVFIGIQKDVQMRVEKYLVGMLDIYDERSVMRAPDATVTGGNTIKERRGVFGLDPLRGNQHLFNFWYIPVPYAYADALSDEDEDFCTKKFDDVQDDCFPDAPREHHIYLGSDISCRTTANWDGWTVIDTSDDDPYLSTQAVTHELAHALFELADEYEEAGLGDNPRFPNCLDAGEEDRAAELEYPDPQYGCSYTADNIRPSEASVMRNQQALSFDELNERWICMKLAEASGYHLRGICNGSSTGFPTNYQYSSCQSHLVCSSGVCSQVGGPGSGHCLAGSLPEDYRCQRDEQCLSGLCRRGLAGFDICYPIGIPDGSACYYDEQCAPNRFCIGATTGNEGRCGLQGGVGDLCVDDQECASGICSDEGYGTKRCQLGNKGGAPTLLRRSRVRFGDVRLRFSNVYPTPLLPGALDDAAVLLRGRPASRQSVPDRHGLSRLRSGDRRRLSRFQPGIVHPALSVSSDTERIQPRVALPLLGTHVLGPVRLHGPVPRRPHVQTVGGTQRRRAPEVPLRSRRALGLNLLDPLVDLLLEVRLRLPVALLEAGHDLFTAALRLFEIVVGELAPLVSELALDLVPSSFDLIPVHRRQV